MDRTARHRTAPTSTRRSRLCRSPTPITRADARDHDALPHDQPHDVAARRAERDARADLARALSHDVRHHTVDADRRRAPSAVTANTPSSQSIELRRAHGFGGDVGERCRFDEDRLRVDRPQRALKRRETLASRSRRGANEERRLQSPGSARRGSTCRGADRRAVRRGGCRRRRRRSRALSAPDLSSFADRTLVREVAPLNRLADDRHAAGRPGRSRSSKRRPASSGMRSALKNVPRRHLPADFRRTLAGGAPVARRARTAPSSCCRSAE